MVILFRDSRVLVIVMEAPENSWLPIQDNHGSSLTRHAHTPTLVPPIRIAVVVTNYHICLETVGRQMVAMVILQT